MSELDPLPDDVNQALRAERLREDPPAETQSGLIASIEASDEYQVATGSRQARASTTVHPLAALKTRTGIMLFVAGAVWGAVLGATAVALIKVPPAPVVSRPDAGQP